MKSTAVAVILAAAVGPLASTGVLAGELVYRPLNPSFGGNPNLSGHLIGLAQIQNKYANGGGGGGGTAPEIVFPPIVIDLGGLGGGAGAPTETADPTAMTMPLTAGVLSN